MAKAGRKPNIEPKVQWKVYIPATLAARIELRLLDPLRDKVTYGARNELIEMLLRRWEQEQTSSTKPPPVTAG